MNNQQLSYEMLLTEYSHSSSAIALLREHRPYLEMLPSMRRSLESVITLPLPLVRLRHRADTASPVSGTKTEAKQLPCDVAILMCDPEWKIKMGVEILVFIHRPYEEFSELLGRWRQAQVTLDRDYEWIMPHHHRHILSEGAVEVHPLFILFSETPERIQRGLIGAGLPVVLQDSFTEADDRTETYSH